MIHLDPDKTWLSEPYTLCEREQAIASVNGVSGYRGVTGSRDGIQCNSQPSRVSAALSKKRTMEKAVEEWQVEIARRMRAGMCSGHRVLETGLRTDVRSGG